MFFRAEPFSKQIERMLNENSETLIRSIEQLQSELAAHKIALKYFTDQSQANKDIVKNLLR